MALREIDCRGMALDRISVWLLPAEPSRRTIAIRFLCVLGAVIVTAALFLIVTVAHWPEAVAAAEQSGVKVKLVDLVHTWTWIGVAIDFFLAIGLLVTLRWWVGGVVNSNLLTRKPSRSFKLGLLLLVVLAFWIRVPRMGRGFYNDEAHNFVRMTSGELRHSSSATDDFVWKPAKWVDTLWYNTAGNNSQPHSILSRLSYTAWRRLFGGADGEVNEGAVRLPALVVGLSGLLLLGVCLGDIAGPRAGQLGMLAGAVHGWHVRYSTEARGYSLLILGVVMMLTFLHQALRTGTWRNWLGYAAGVLICVWSFNGSVYFLAVFNALLLIQQVLRWHRGELYFDQILRPLICCLFAVMVALPLMLPHIPQLLRVLNEWDSIKGGMGAAWWTDVGGYLIAGCRWLDGQPDNPLNVTVSRILASHPWTMIFVAVNIGILIFGSVRLIRLGGAPRLMVIAVPLSIVLAWALMSRKGNYLHHWYLVYALPWLFCAMGTGLDAVFSLIEKRFPRPRGLVLQLAAAVWALTPSAYVGWQFRTLGKQDERAAVIAVRGAVYPHYQKTEHGSKPLIGAFWCNSVIYDPLSVIIREPEDLETLVQRSKNEYRPLYVTFSHRSFAESFLPDVVKRMENRAEFEPSGVFYGQEEAQFTSYLFRLRDQVSPP